VKLMVDRIIVHAAPERVDPRALRAGIQRELAHAFESAPAADRRAMPRIVGDAVRMAVKGGGR
jgi:hypothetical protein